MAAEVMVLTKYRSMFGNIELGIKFIVAGAAGTTVEWTDESINSAGVPDEVVPARGHYADNQSLDLLLAAIYPGNGDEAAAPHMVLAYRHFIGDQEVNLYDDVLGAVGRQQILSWLTSWKSGAVEAATAQLTPDMTRQAAIDKLKSILQPQ